MKQTITYLIMFLVSTTMMLSQEIQKAHNNLDTIDASLSELIAAHSDLFPNNTQLSITLVHGDDTSYIGVLRKNDSLQVINNRKAIFEIGSITKVFTSLLFSKFIQENKVQATETLFNSLNLQPENAPEEALQITLTMLANHSSGLPRLPQNMYPLLEKNMQNPYAEYSEKLLLEYLNTQLKLDRSPGEAVAYSNLGAGMLGYVLTQKAKLSYEELLQQYILQPLQMKHSTTKLTHIDTQLLVVGQNPKGKSTANWTFTDALVGAGGLKSNAVDMEKFIRKHFENDKMYILPKQPTITMNPSVKVGLGWHLITQLETTYLFHNGGTGGYLSCLLIDTEHKKAVLVLSNVSAFGANAQKIDALCFSLMKTLKN